MNMFRAFGGVGEVDNAGAVPAVPGRGERGAAAVVRLVRPGLPHLLLPAAPTRRPQRRLVSSLLHGSFVIIISAQNQQA